MDSNSFKGLSLCQPVLRALAEEGYEKPTAIQQAAIPEVLAGKDLLATAQTGTGKTAAFALPILQLLNEQRSPNARHIRALVLTPTRELALQIDANLRTYGKHLPLRSTVVLGGVSMGGQIKALRRHPDMLVATPGRLLDLLRQGQVRLDRVSFFVLDEADRMLDMGFVQDVRKIASELPEVRQTLLFSATMSSEITRLASCMLRNPSRVATTPEVKVADNIAQKVLFVDHKHKRALLTDILRDEHARRVLIFTRTKHRANHLMQQLTNQGIASDAIHSNKSQNARQRALAAFDRGRIKVLVGTDIVARGIDVENISHVINYELPEDPENYVHRIGRTARAGAAGIALSFCDAEEVPMLRGIEKLTRNTLTADEDHAYHSPSIAALRDQIGFGSPKPRRFSRGGAPKRNGRPRSGSSFHSERSEKGRPFEKFRKRNRSTR